MSDDEFRAAVAAYRASIEPEAQTHFFAWSARLLTPHVSGDGTITRECFGTVSARTWLEAGAMIALHRLRLDPEFWFTDVLVRKGEDVALAWDRDCVTQVLDSPTLHRKDGSDVCGIRDASEAP
jgi:hypothetical protein